MSNITDYLFAAALVGLLLWQLRTGKALDRRLRPSVTREDNPGMYWAVLLIQAGFLMLILVKGTASWHFR